MHWDVIKPITALGANVVYHAGPHRVGFLILNPLTLCSESPPGCFNAAHKEQLLE